MTLIYHRFGQTTLAKVKSSKELRQLFSDPWFNADTIIFKPNWVSKDPADFTDAKTLQMIFETIESNIAVTESYGLYRSLNLLADGLPFIVNEKEVNWKWLLKGDGWNWLIEKEDWDWFKENGHWDQIKQEDQAFLDEQGFTDLFTDFNVNYINVTEEVWRGRIAPPSDMQRQVETRFKPVHTNKIYSMVPKKLYNLRGSMLISLAKLKMYPTFTIKNLFGMIPDPLKPWWHGPKNTRITYSILDINKVYHALFNVYGIGEALNTWAFRHPNGAFEGIYARKYNVLTNVGVLGIGRNLVALDSILCSLTGFNITDVIGDHINKAEEELGTYDRALLRTSQIKTGNWLTHLH